MSDSDPTSDAAVAADETGARGADVRLVLGVAVLFALLGALLARVASGGSLDGVLAGALALLVVTAAVAVFGADAVRAAAALLRS